jgi:hypothetical protein
VLVCAPNTLRSAAATSPSMSRNASAHTCSRSAYRPGASRCVVPLVDG